MGKAIKARWQNRDGDATEEATLREAEDGIVVESIIRSQGREDFTASYSIVCDALWRVRQVKIALAGREKKLELGSDGFGTWSNNSGVIGELSGAIDVDISATPFTNTLPIRRLGLQAGQSAEILAVYITVPELGVSLDGQRYTCIIPNKLYRYESLDSDFVREIEVDEHGLVLLYPGLFRRA